MVKCPKCNGKNALYNERYNVIWCPECLGQHKNILKEVHVYTCDMCGHTAFEPCDIGVEDCHKCGTIHSMKLTKVDEAFIGYAKTGWDKFKEVHANPDKAFIDKALDTIIQKPYSSNNKIALIIHGGAPDYMKGEYKQDFGKDVDKNIKKLDKKKGTVFAGLGMEHFHIDKHQRENDNDSTLMSWNTHPHFYITSEKDVINDKDIINVNTSSATSDALEDDHIQQFKDNDHIKKAFAGRTVHFKKKNDQGLGGGAGEKYTFPETSVDEFPELKDYFANHPRLVREASDVPEGSHTPTVDQITKKHNVDKSEIEKQLEMGIKVEFEHSRSEKVAKQIALDHLWEIPNYYTELDKMEKAAKAKLQEMLEEGDLINFNKYKKIKKPEGYFKNQAEKEMADRVFDEIIKDIKKRQEKGEQEVDEAFSGYAKTGNPDSSETHPIYLNPTKSEMDEHIDKMFNGQSAGKRMSALIIHNGGVPDNKSEERHKEAEKHKGKVYLGYSMWHISLNDHHQDINPTDVLGMNRWGHHPHIYLFVDHNEITDKKELLANISSATPIEKHKEHFEMFKKNKIIAKALAGKKIKLKGSGVDEDYTFPGKASDEERPKQRYYNPIIQQFRENKDIINEDFAGYFKHHWDDSKPAAIYVNPTASEIKKHIDEMFANVDVEKDPGHFSFTDATMSSLIIHGGGKSEEAEKHKGKVYLSHNVGHPTLEDYHTETYPKDDSKIDDWDRHPHYYLVAEKNNNVPRIRLNLSSATPKHLVEKHIRAFIDNDIIKKAFTGKTVHIFAEDANRYVKHTFEGETSEPEATKRTYYNPIMTQFRGGQE